MLLAADYLVSSYRVSSVISASLLPMSGRPSKGVRRQVNVRMDPGLVVAVDKARGPMSRDDWFDGAARLALRPTSQLVMPELKQDVHVHSRGRPLRTEMFGLSKIKIWECSTCGSEMQA